MELPYGIGGDYIPGGAAVANSPQCGIIKTKEVSHEYAYLQGICPAVEREISRAEGKRGSA
jgi:hypothetical protein